MESSDDDWTCDTMCGPQCSDPLNCRWKDDEEEDG